MHTIETAFPKLTPEDIDALRPFASEQRYADGDIVYKAGSPDMSCFVVLSGEIEITNPSDNNAHVASHKPGDFSGDIDLLTRRPIIVNGIARGNGGGTTCLKIPYDRLRDVLNHIPRLGEIFLEAFQARRFLLNSLGNLGMRVIGPGACKDTTRVREFLYKNFVPFVWLDTVNQRGQDALKSIGSPKKTPAIVCNDGKILLNPPLRELAKCAGIWRECPDDNVDLAIVGAGPAGIAAAVYAASEGLKTVVLDTLGPGGQAAGSSKIENFIGFPSGLSGADLATRGVLQMLKFGAKMVAPICVTGITPAANDNERHALHLDCGNTLHATVVLVATGVRWRKLAAKNIDTFDGRGIYYACTTVEADLHGGQDVAVVGAGNSAGQAAMFLAERCARTVYVIIRRELGIGMSDYLADRIRNTANIKVLNFTEVTEVHGDSRIRALSLQTDGKPDSQINVAAMFIFIGAEPSIPWLPDSDGNGTPGAARDKLGYLLTGVDAEKSGKWPLQDRTPCPLETTIPRVLAAGDVRSGSTKRVGFAVGDGSLAVTCTHRRRTRRV
jgi:thioredoxin reductase (NADPH)